MQRGSSVDHSPIGTQVMDRNLAPDRLLASYASGIFPMADEAGSIQWFAPDPRAIIELNGLIISRSLRSLVRRRVFEIRINTAFSEVMRACADRYEGTWISNDIHEAYTQLHRLGFAHSVEAWKDDELVGGLYGVSIGGAFFGESMFHRATGASKAALVHLVGRMKQLGLSLLDVQFITEHLRSLGAVEISRSTYEKRLAQAVDHPCTFG